MVYGSPFFATTHIILIEECKNKNIKFKVVYNASIFDAIGETGLQLYKFGKICSMPKWQENFKPDSFIDIVKENKKNNHSLILIDIGLDFKTAIEQLIISGNNKKLKLDKIIVCSALGSKKSKIYYGNIKNLENKNITNKIKTPFCFIIPGNLHFFEKQVVRGFLER